MARGEKKTIGDFGEEYVAKNAPCPACGKPFTLLPEGYPLFDLQCSSCTFRCQVKTTRRRPSNSILGAGWKIFSAALKTGQQVPPLIYVANLDNKTGARPAVRFFPFIPRCHLKKRQPFPAGHKREKYLQFTYVRMDLVPSFILNEKNRWEPEAFNGA